MSNTHDFNDGNGPVPAHRHSNGGGWVADTAKVDASAHVGPDAKVYGYAHVSGNAHVYGNACVSGYAQVYGDAQLYGYAWVCGNARVYGDDNAAKIAELTRKLDALRNEVKAWREWHNKEQEIFVEELLLYQAAINASRNTDTLKALEDERDHPTSTT